MKRRIVHFLTAASLLVCLAIAILWARSYFRYDSLGRRSSHSAIQVLSLRGTLVFGRFHYYDYERFSPQTDEWNFYSGPSEDFNGGIDAAEESDSWRTAPIGSAFPTEGETAYQKSFERLGMGFAINHGEYGIDYRSIFSPHWLLVVVFGVPPAWCLRRYAQQRRRLMNDVCAKCGYDLRATPDRCPECGTARAR
jgi:hypothetical protein